DDPVQVLAQDGVVRRLDDRRQEPTRDAALSRRRLIGFDKLLASTRLIYWVQPTRLLGHGDRVYDGRRVAADARTEVPRDHHLPDTGWGVPWLPRERAVSS